MTSLILSIILACASHNAGTTTSNPPSVIPTEEKVSQQGPQETKGITGVEVLGQIDLKTEFDGFQNQVIMRARRLSIAKDGVVASHEHQSRPGVAFMLEGEMTEFRSGEAIKRSPGELSFERTGVTHWWENLSGAPATALVIDILSPKETIVFPPYTTTASPENASKENTGLSIVQKNALSLTGEHPALEGKSLRVRVIDIAPEGTVGLHLHQSRPGFAYIIKGQLTESRNDQTEPHQHGDGVLVVERTGVEHWWHNESTQSARVLVVDIVSE